MGQQDPVKKDDPFMDADIQAAIHAPSKLLAEAFAARALEREQWDEDSGVRPHPALPGDPNEEWPTVSLRPAPGRERESAPVAEPTAVHAAVDPDEWPTDVVPPKKAAK